ncbi:D-alanyl-D-alanine carboxypeptidase [Virgibacillus sp. NKC19-16]|uniref:serine hydrolase n=1 Tax=Virgibacillus salidurans TaxID=2831673 RepID=UPI001F46B2DD|nr:serine hydrolase [Virgibacillus sp. NKC19-16]UJL46420.1 D-alanyl-D-alanine carboxypeptidase [Virgibacillus sp. NKC19-16]
MKQIKKNLLFLVASFVLITSVIVQPISAQAADTLDLDAESAILVDAETGKVLYAKDPDVALPPASMTKMMTEYLVLEAIDAGEISWDTTTQISDYAYSISANPSFSGVGLRQDQDYTVRELYEAMAIFSDNATTIALAELIAGTETEFVALMNEKAEELNLPEYKFVNSTGLDNSSLGDNRPEGTGEDETSLLSAKSAALLAYHLVNNYPEALEISSQTEVEFEGYTLENLNWMLPHDATFLEQFYYEGMDGLKTGNTELAGFTFTGTAERNGKRLISVVMKTDSKEERFNETEKLMDYGFEQFETIELFPAGHQVENESSIPVAKGKEDTLDVSIAESFTVPVKSGEEELYSVEYTVDEDYLNEDGELIAPIEEGEKVGTAELVYDGETDHGYIFDDSRNTVDLVANDSVEKNNWFMLSIGAVGDFFANLFTTSVDWIKGLFS